MYTDTEVFSDEDEVEQRHNDEDGARDNISVKIAVIVVGDAIITTQHRRLEGKNDSSKKYEFATKRTSEVIDREEDRPHGSLVTLRTCSGNHN